MHCNFVLLLAIVSGLVAASPIDATGAAAHKKGGCKKPKEYVSWLDMKKKDKESYFRATQCLLSSPAKTKLPGVKTRWDDLAALHQLHALQIHSTGTFLPYHRYFLHLHGVLLKECGYKGPLAYWDEIKDAGHFSASPVLVEFGGGGVGDKNCIAKGPFAKATVNIGPGFTSAPRCVNRLINDDLSALTAVGHDQIRNATGYWDMQEAIYAGPHLWGHAGLGMMDGDSITSAGDPLFMLHHGWVDKLWADWQAASPSRLRMVDGPNDQDPAIGFSEFPGSMEDEAKGWGKPTEEMKKWIPNPQSGDGGPTTTLNHVMTSFGMIPDVIIREILDTKGDFLCYKYV